MRTALETVARRRQAFISRGPWSAPTGRSTSSRHPPRHNVGRTLAVADVGALALALWACTTVVPVAGRPEILGRSPAAQILALILAVTLGVSALLLQGLYRREVLRPHHSTVEDFGRIFNAISMATILLVVLSYGAGAQTLSAQQIMVFWGSALVFVSAGRIAARAVCRQRRGSGERTLIVGAGTAGQGVALKILRHPEYGLELLGFVDDDPLPLSGPAGDVPVLAGRDGLTRWVSDLAVSRVILAYSAAPEREMAELARTLRNRGVQVDVVPRLFDSVGPGATLRGCEGLQLISLVPVSAPRSRVSKRLLDLAVAVPAAVLLAPLLVIIGVVVRLSSPGPAFYRHERVGKGGRPIEVLKFRTMALSASTGDRYGGAAADSAFHAN